MKEHTLIALYELGNLKIQSFAYDLNGNIFENFRL
jgi:hypothetical protein